MNQKVPVILNVDDDEGGRYAMSRVLRQAGFSVTDAASGMEGLELAAKLQPDLVLLDVRLPDIDGFEVCRRIRADAQLASIAVVQCSASFLDTSSRVRGLENGADAYLTEPVEPAVLIATVRSLLRLKRAEMQVRESARQWQHTFDALREGIALLDADGNVVRSNAAFSITAGEEGSTQRRAIADAFGRLLRLPGRQSRECISEERIYSVGLEPVRDDAGQVSGAVCVVTDTTEEREFERQMQQTARLESIGVLAGGIAHDYNNLLTGIIGNASLLIEQMPASSPDREIVNEILRAGDSAADLTRQLLAYAGKGQFTTESVDLSESAARCIAFVRRFTPGKVELFSNLAADLPPIEGDGGQIQQVVMNLILNAIESFGENRAGEVHVTTRVEMLGAEFFTGGEPAAPGRYASIVVSDNGAGMDEATQSRIFDPFFTTKFTGRGLGLSAVHGILRGHKGVLRLSSKAGVGTTFRVYFPAATSEIREVPRTEVREIESCGGTVLVIDDESTVRRVAYAALTKRGYTVLLAEDGTAGLGIFRSQSSQIDLILLDLTMPVMDGEETFVQLRAVSERVPIIVCSGFSPSVLEERFRGKDVAAFLGKPFGTVQLAETVGQVLGASRISEKARRQHGCP